MILYSLCELSIKLGDVVNAIEYFKEFVQVAPRDTGRFVLKYKLYTAQEVGLEERISVLEELQQYECKEKWMYELAYLYHMQGFSDKCVEECNQIVIYFGEGKYVIKALELKALHEPLSGEQDIIYRRLTGPKENDILVKDMDVSKFNTIDLQKELANSLAEVLYDDTKPLPHVTDEMLVKQEPVEEPVAGNEPIVEESAVEELVIEEPVIEEPVYETVEEQEQIIETKAEPVAEPVSTDTKIFNAKDVEAALNIEPEKKDSSNVRTVYPQRNFDEMHEVMPRSQRNPAIVFPNYDDMVSMEGDGQISFNVPEQEMVEKQITGQISIDEVLAEWERMKNANERKWREDMRRKVMQQTNVMFADFAEASKDGLLEQLENEVVESDTVILTKEEEERLIEENLTPEVTEITKEAVSEEASEPESVNDEVLESEEVTEETAETEDETEEVEAEPKTEEVPTGDIREIIIEDDEPSAEELFFDRTPYLEKEIELAPEEISIAAEPASEDNTGFLPGGDQLDSYLNAFAEASEQRDLVDLAVREGAEFIIEALPESNEEETTPEEPVMVEETSVEEETVVEEETLVEEVPVAEEETLVEDEPIAEEETSVEDEPAVEKETSVEEESVAEEETTVEETVVEKEASVEETATEEEPSEPVIRPSGFTAEQEERFEAFIQTEAARDQLKEVLANISMECGHGNVIIGSEDVDGSVELAKAIMMELSAREGITGKVAKIKASTLNAKDAEETLQKLYDGALIIQDANELRVETLDAVRKIVSAQGKRIFVILTATKRAKHKFIMENSDLLESFNVSIDIDALTNKELVAYAKGYAYSKEYAIDEMGMLALHTRIDEKQTNEHSVTITEVKAMVDEAIAKATKKNVKHFMDVLVGKRYDDNDMVVLKEKDFAE